MKLLATSYAMLKGPRSNVQRFGASNEEEKCLHFTASSKGLIFLIFATVPNNKDTWYVLVSPYGVGIFKVRLLAFLTVTVISKHKIACQLYEISTLCSRNARLKSDRRR